jgi:hypothetical protein
MRLTEGYRYGFNGKEMDNEAFDSRADRLKDGLGTEHYLPETSGLDDYQPSKDTFISNDMLWINMSDTNKNEAHGIPLKGQFSPYSESESNELINKYDN